MASWKFTDDYGKQYPALTASVLGLLVFSDHSIDGEKFSGTIDFGATGAALGTLGKLAGLSSLAVSGTVTNANDTLTVKFASQGSSFQEGLAKTIPILGPKLSAASLAVNTIAKTSENADEGPGTDKFAISITIPIGSASITLTSSVPMFGGTFAVDGTFTGVAITLEDVAYLTGKLSDGTSWFPGSQLGPYYSKGAALSLLGVEVMLGVTLSPFAVNVLTVGIGIGLVGFALLDQKLYLSPLGVWALVTDPVNSPQVAWSIVGSLALCSYERPGDYQDPDLSLDLAMDLTNRTFSAQLENPSKISINTALQDLLGKGTSIVLPSELTLEAFDLEIAANKQSGSLSSFSADLTLSGGFGLLANLDLEEIRMSVAYNA